MDMNLNKHWEIAENKGIWHAAVHGMAKSRTWLCEWTTEATILHLNSTLKPFSSVQSLNCAWLFATPWTAACQASLSIANSQSLLKLKSIELVMPSISSSVIPFFSCLQSFPASGSFPMSQFFTSGGQSIEVSASAWVLPMNSQHWFPLGLTGWISLQSKGLFKSLLQHHSSKASVLRPSAFFIVPTLTSIHDYWKNHSFD